MDYNTDDTTNIKGLIQWKACMKNIFHSFQEAINLMVLNLGYCQVILKILWL